MQMVCGEAQAGAGTGASVRRRPSGASDGGQPNRCWRRSANRKRWAGVQPAPVSMASARWTWCGRRCGQSHQRGAECFGLRPKTAQPELAALVRHRRRRGCGRRRGREETGHEPPGDEREAGAEVRQCELREQGNGKAAGFTQIAAHADRSVKSGVDDGADVEAVRGEWIFGLTLRAAGGAMLVRTVELGEVLLHRTGEWV